MPPHSLTEGRGLWLGACWAILTILWLCGACASGPYAWHPPTRADVPANATPQLVARRLPYLQASDIPSGWRRLDDPLTGPYYFLFSTQNYACLVSAADFTMAKEQEEWLCVWRRWR